MKKKILVLGSNGFIGRAISKKLKKNHYLVLELNRKDYSDFNIKKKKYPDLGKFDVIIFCAGISQIDECEKNKKSTKYINSECVYDIFEKYGNYNTQIVAFSSSHVFSGNKKKYTIHNKRYPKTIYGMQKVNLENNIYKLNGLIIRTTKVINSDYYRFKEWSKMLRQNQIIQPAANLNVSLVFLNTLTDLTDYLIKIDYRGLEQLSGKDQISYYKIALKIAKINNFNKKLIIPKFLNQKFISFYGKHSVLKLTKNAKKFQSFTADQLTSKMNF